MLKMKLLKSVNILLLAVVLSTGCKDENQGPTATVNLNFLATYDGSPLVFQQTYDYADGHKLLLQRLDFYISNVALVDANGNKTELVDVDFLDFTENTTLSEAETPLTLRADEVPAGSYTGLQIGIGVPAELNNENANQLPVGNPLRDTYNAQFWSDWGSFIFLKSEGIYDNDNDGNIENNGDDHPFGHHCGTNESYVMLTINKPIEVLANETLNLNFTVDWLQLYNHDSGMHDFSDPTKLYTHNPNDLTLAKQIMGNFVKALSLN